MTEEVAFRESPHHVVVDEFEYFFFLGVLLETGVFDVSIDHDKIFRAFASESRDLVLTICGHVLEEKFPNFTPMSWVR